MYNESLPALHCSRSWFSLEKKAASASVTLALVEAAHESMLMRERLVVSGQSSPWQNVIVRSSDPIALGLSVAWTAGEVVASSVAVDVSASRLVDRLTARQLKSVSFELRSPKNPGVPSGSRKRAAGPKAREIWLCLFVRKQKK